MISGVGGSLIALGVLGWFFAAILLTGYRSALRLSRRLADSPVVACGDLAGGKLPRRVVLAGTIGPGPDGIVIAPISGTPCVWFRIGFSKEEDGRTTSAHTSGPVTLTDDTGTVLVDARLIDRDLLDSDRHRSPLDRGFRGDEDESLILQRFKATRHITRAWRLKRRGHDDTSEHNLRSGVALTLVGKPRKTSHGIVVGVCAGSGVSAHDVPTLREEVAAEKTDTANLTRWCGYLGGAMVLLGGTVLALGDLLA